MTNEQLLELLGDTDEDLLEKAGINEIDLDRMRNDAEMLVEECTEAVRLPKRRCWMRITAAAACLGLCVGVGVFLHGRSGGLSPGGTAQNLQQIPGAWVADNAEVFEIYAFDDFSEYKSGNPWHADADLKTLPVYENFYHYVPGEPYEEADEVRMTAILEEVAGILNAEYETNGVTPILMEDSNRLNFLSAEDPAQQIYFHVDSFFTAHVAYQDAETYSSGGTIYEDYCESAALIRTMYPMPFGMQSPVSVVESCDYRSQDENLYKISVYEDGDTLTEDILNYNLSRIRVLADDADPHIRHFQLDNIDRTHKLGDYPILTPEEAQTLFLNGNYLDAAREANLLPDTITIEAVELLYRTGNEERCYMPYYRFFIPIHNQSDGEMQAHYGAFYVPAVEPQYLDMQ